MIVKAWLASVLAVALGAWACSNSNFAGAGGKSRGADKGDKDSKDGDDDDDSVDEEGKDAGGGGGVDGNAGDPTNGGISTSARDGETAVPQSSDDQGSAGQVFDDGAGARRELFDFGADAKTPVVDYLFVLDNSPSMGDNIAQLQAGFKSLTEDLFPKKAKVGVIYTMPAKKDDLNVSFNGAQQQPLIAANSEPGFMGLVNADRIKAYKAANGAKAGKFAMPGCVAGWFDPQAKDAAGNRCIDAHTQVSLAGGPCEAGLVSLRQTLEKLANKPLFRTAAVANVIFVSDTHDPGCDAGEGKGTLDPLRPKLADLKALVDKAGDVSSLKAHAIVPHKGCQGSEGVFPSGTTYLDVVTEAKGKTLDLCESKDFKGILEKIVTEDSKPEAAVFQLSAKAAEVISVSVDGVKTDKFTLKNGDTVVIDGLDPAKKVKVQIYYKVQQ